MGRITNSERNTLLELASKRFGDTATAILTWRAQRIQEEAEKIMAAVDTGEFATRYEQIKERYDDALNVLEQRRQELLALDQDMRSKGLTPGRVYRDAGHEAWDCGRYIGTSRNSHHYIGYRTNVKGVRIDRDNYFVPVEKGNYLPDHLLVVPDDVLVDAEKIVNDEMKAKKIPDNEDLKAAFEKFYEDLLLASLTGTDAKALLDAIPTFNPEAV